MARSGYEAAKILAKRNNEIVLSDINPNQDKSHIKELEDLGVKLYLGEQPENVFDETFDLMVKNPGVKFDNKYVVYAVEHGIDYEFLRSGEITLDDDMSTSADYLEAMMVYMHNIEELIGTILSNMN